MNSSLVFVLVAVAAVVALGLFMRRGESGMSPPAEGRPEPGTSPSGRDEAGGELDDDSDEAFDEEAEAVAVTSDGHSFLPDVHAVRIVPPGEADEGQPWSKAPDEPTGGRHRRGEIALARSLHAGDLTGVRVTRGGADEAPWRLETMGRDADYDYWGFETREAAEAAKGLLEARGVVKLGQDEDGRPMPPSREAWDEARRIWEETQSELLMDLPEEPGSPKPE